MLMLEKNEVADGNVANPNPLSRPHHIELAHWQEWVNLSTVDPTLTALNAVSLSGFEPYERLLYAVPASERRNDGRLRDKWIGRYTHCERGGWWCSGVDVLTGDNAAWGQFKPDTPYNYEAKTAARGFATPDKVKNKIIKYEPPRNVPTEIFTLKVPLEIWNAISQRYNVPLPENIVVTPQGRALGFWNWVLENPKIPVIITEGAKKAGALLSAGYCAIALPGIYNGYRQPKDDWGNKLGNPKLIPQLAVFAREGREISFCFDSDRKPKTIKNVRQAIAVTGRLFVSESCQVSVIIWDDPEKGVDDLITARGQNYFHDLYKSRIPLSKFNLAYLVDLSKYQPLKVNQPYLGDNLVAPEGVQLIGLRSPKGSNKTGWLAKVTEQAISQGQPVLVITHRIQLAKALCARFGIDHIEEIGNSETKGALGYGLCIDSLHPNSQAFFNPEYWESAVVVLDECEQVIWHMLDSTTCQDNRVAIIENFQRLLKIVIGTGGKIYLSDADLSQIALDYVQKLIDIPVKIWVVENLYNSSEKRKLVTYSGSDPRALVSALVGAIERGEKVLVHTTGQKAKSKWGSINLESYLEKQFRDRRILRIDRDSVAEPGHPAYGCMANLNSILQHYDVVICSPVIETGVSIDLKGYFDSVWGIAQGVQTVDAVCQALERLRDDVPRHLWVKTTAKGNRIGNGSTSVKSLLATTHQLTRTNISLLQQVSISDFDELNIDFSPESLTTWARRACMVNLGKNNYRDNVVSKLIAEGYELDDPGDLDLANCDLIKEQIKQTCQANYQQYCQAVPQVETPSDSELEALSNKRTKNQEERHRERKGQLSKRYGVEVTPELVEKDDRGWYPQLQLHYYLTVGNIYLAERDRRSLSQLKKQGNNKIFKPDINKRQLSAQIRALQLIGIEQFLNPEAEFTKDSLADWFEMVLKWRFEIKSLLRININPENDSAIAVAQRILKKLGLRLELKHQIRINGERTRIYQGCRLNPDGRTFVFDNWLERDLLQLAVTPFFKEDLYTGVVTA